MVCTATLAALVAHRRPGWRGTLYGISAVWTLLVEASMVFHRYHWLSEVLASLLLGAAILLAVDLDRSHAGRDDQSARSTST